MGRLDLQASQQAVGAWGYDAELVALAPFCSFPCADAPIAGIGGFPDVYALARGADAGRADLRMLVLTRPAHEHRHGWGEGN